MSFDIYVQRFQGGELVDLDQSAIRIVLDSARPLDDGGFIIETPDGGTCILHVQDLGADGRLQGLAFFLRASLTPQLARLIFNAARTTDAVLVGVTEPLHVVLTAPNQREQLPPLPGWEEPVLCHSGDELKVFLDEGYAVWQRYRDQILKAKTPPKLRAR